MIVFGRCVKSVHAVDLQPVGPAGGLAVVLDLAAVVGIQSAARPAVGAAPGAWLRTVENGAKGISNAHHPGRCPPAACRVWVASIK